MKKRSLWAVAASLLLVLANVWRWWPEGGSRATPALARTVDSVADGESVFGELRFRVSANTDALPPVRRDLFLPNLPPPPKPKKPVNAEPPPKTAEQIAEDEARTELAQLKLIGVLWRENEREAFVSSRGQYLVVRHGSRVGEHFVVEEISAESLSVRDPATNVAGRLALSGSVP
jgi:hypothetical protein